MLARLHAPSAGARARRCSVRRIAAGGAAAAAFGETWTCLLGCGKHPCTFVLHPCRWRWWCRGERAGAPAAAVHARAAAHAAGAPRKTVALAALCARASAPPVCCLLRQPPCAAVMAAEVEQEWAAHGATQASTEADADVWLTPDQQARLPIAPERWSFSHASLGAPGGVGTWMLRGGQLVCGTAGRGGGARPPRAQGVAWAPQVGACTSRAHLAPPPSPPQAAWTASQRATPFTAFCGFVVCWALALAARRMADPRGSVKSAAGVALLQHS